MILTGENDGVLGENPVTVSVCPSQIPQGLALESNLSLWRGADDRTPSHGTALNVETTDCRESNSDIPISSLWSSHCTEKANTDSTFLPLGTDQLLLGACTDT